MSAFAESLKDYVCVVSGNLPEQTVTFLTEYSETLDSRGYSRYSKGITSYLKGSFGSGFVYYASNGKPYVITNRHVVEESSTVNIQFENADGSSSEYKELKIIAIDEDIDVALIVLPDAFNRKGLEASSTLVEDGADVWSAGFPGLGGTPMWQLGKGTVTNSSAKIKELLSPEISTIIQHSAQIDGGNSGGPLLVKDESSGVGYKVIGINTWKAVARQSTNYSIPIKVVSAFVEKNLTENDASKTIEDRIAEFILANGDKDQAFLAVAKFISNDMVAACGGDAFFAVLGKASTSVRSAIVDIFNYDPIEGLRYSLAFQTWQTFQGTDGVLAIETDTPIVTSLGTKVDLTPEGKDSVSSLWILEQGNWRISEFSEIEGSKLAKKENDTSADYSFSMKDPYFITVSAGFMPGNSGARSVSVLFTSNSLGFGAFYQKDTVDVAIDDDVLNYYGNDKIENEISIFGVLARFRVPLAFGKLVFSPYGEVRFGIISNQSEKDTCENVLVDLGAGLGLDFSYSLAEHICPVVGVEYLTSRYNTTISSSKATDVVLSVGIRLLGSE